MRPNRTPHLEALAHAYGIHTSYTDVFGARRVASTESLLAALQSLGAGVDVPKDAPEALRRLVRDRSRSVLPPVAAAWGGVLQVELVVPERKHGEIMRLVLELEGGPTLDLDVLPADLTVQEQVEDDGQDDGRVGLRFAYGYENTLPPGYHRLWTEEEGRVWECLVISAPREAYPGRPQSWGVFIPAYSLQSNESWGCGDLSDLRRLGSWVRSLGGDFIATLPLLSSYLDEPFQPSPYAPVSRLFWNELFLDVYRVPELERCPAGRQIIESSRFRNEVADLRTAPLVDYWRAAALRRSVLEEMAHSFFADPAGERLQRFRRFVADNPAVEDYALFRAVAETQAAPWQAWPEPARGGSPRTEDFDPATRSYHTYVQWIIDEQMGALAAESDLHLDFPLGVHPGGYDTWRNRNAFASGMSVGAPPDTFFTKGQNWGLPPPDPRTTRATGYRYLRSCLQAHLQFTRYLRIDHIMGLHRLFWIPSGADAADGVYVSYPADEVYALLALESERHSTTIVGEDLGTVPPEVRPAMAEHGIRRLFVLQYELEPEEATTLPPAPAQSIASLNTHDMPPFASFLEARWHRRSLSRAEARRELRAVLAHLAAGNAEAVQVNLEDLWLETEPQNVPATGLEQPNWRRKAAYSLEEIVRLSSVRETLEHVDSLRRGEESPMTTPEGTNRALLTDQDIYLFNEGSHLDLADKLGVHLGNRDGVEGAFFAVWAPNAEQVSVIGSFNDWSKEANLLHPYGSSGIWEGFVPGASRGDTYKYHILAAGGSYRVDKADPVGIHHETPPLTGSKVWDLDYEWNDGEWMAFRAERNSRHAPISVYEVHPGSWVRDDGSFLTYRELAPRLADHVIDMGFTHVEFLPIMEHPFYGSWGYQVTGYFAPTSRYGTPQDFMYLVDYLHQRGIGVIVDWVPSHFPNDEHGLVWFDGTHLYEHADPRLGFHPDWQSMIFNFGRHEVRSFLLSSALFWLGRYHVDGLRVDAVASLLYRDYSRKGGDWIPNQYGGRENLEAIDLLRRMNKEIYRRHPDTQTIAEESTAWPMVSRPTYVGGLGFGLKWDMGWMHDTLEYMSRDPIHRRYHHNRLTFRMVYAFTENFMLPLSHDEVVHGKGSLLAKMPGDTWQKFANLRLLLTYMFTQPGKKLLFMGAEIGQWREWDHESALDWHLLGNTPHAGVQELVRQLNRMYREEPALYEVEDEPDGFEWISADDSENSVIAYLRKPRSSDDVLLVACNFTPIPRYNYQVGVSRKGTWIEVMNSDAADYGGSGHGNLGGVEAAPLACHGRSHCLNLTLPPLGAVVMKSPAAF